MYWGLPPPDPRLTFASAIPGYGEEGALVHPIGDPTSAISFLRPLKLVGKGIKKQVVKSVNKILILKGVRS